MFFSCFGVVSVDNNTKTTNLTLNMHVVAVFVIKEEKNESTAEQSGR